MGNNEYTINYIEGDIGNQIHEVAIHGGQIEKGDLKYIVDGKKQVKLETKEGVDHIDLEVAAYKAQFAYTGKLTGYRKPLSGSEMDKMNILGRVKGTDK